MYIAVYGTLKKDNHNHPLIEKSEFIGHSKVYGYQMYCIGNMTYGHGYPYIVPEISDKEIPIEVYKVDSNTAQMVDYLEIGYSKETVIVDVDGKKYPVSIYIVNEKNSRFKMDKPIESNTWEI